MCGRDKTYYTFEPTVIKGLDSLNDRDATHLMYAYSVRNLGNPELHKAFEKKLDKIASNLDYPSLFNAFYYLLFKESGNKALFQKLVDATVANPDILPIIYYRPFKAARFYMEGKFKDSMTNMDDFVDKHWHAERYFNVYKLEEYIERDVTYYNFKGFLNARCFVYPISFMTINNLFLMHYVFNDQKIAINFHLEKFMPTERADVGATEMQKLSSKVLKHDGWEILDLTEKEFNSWTFDERVANVTGWLREAKERQVKKGVMEAKPKQYV